MGISLHYSGKFNPSKSLSNLIIEVKEIAEAFGWKYFIYDTEFPKKISPPDEHNDSLYGIRFSPPESEPVEITFTSNQRMTGVMNFQCWGKSSDPREMEYLYAVSTKTQFAGPESHKMIVEIMRHLNNRGYFLDFQMTDESDYWETGDEKVMVQKFKFLGAMIEGLSLAIQTTPKSDDESYEGYFERLCEMVRKKNDSKQTD